MMHINELDSTIKSLNSSAIIAMDNFIEVFMAVNPFRHWIAVFYYYNADTLIWEIILQNIWQNINFFG